MKIVILQPGYLQWLGAYAQMDWSDTFVIYSDVSFDKNGWRNRNLIKTPQGSQWLTVPVLTKGRDFPLIKDVLINNDENWRDKHLKSIRQNYSKAAYFKNYIGMFEEIYSKEWKYLIDIDMAFIFALKDILGIQTKIEYSTGLHNWGDKFQRLIDICIKLGADEFLEGNAGKYYLDGEGERRFAESHIKLIYQNYHHPEYKQLYGAFIPYLSVIDLIFNNGKDSLNIIRKENE